MFLQYLNSLSTMRKMHLLLVFLVSQVFITKAWVGVNFALMQQHSPLNPQKAAKMFNEAYPNVKHFKTFIYDRKYLNALQNRDATNVLVGVPNEELAIIAGDVNKALEIIDSVKDFAMQITLAVGTQPLAPWWNNQFAPHVVDAFKMLRQAIEQRELKGTIQLTVPFFHGMLSKDYPPQASQFAGEYEETVRTIAQMLKEDGGFFCINIYPWFTYRANQGVISLDYALLKHGHNVGGKYYQNLLMVQIAAVREALLKLDQEFDDSKLPLVIGETGWPTAGHKDATVANAATYINNVVDMAQSGAINVFLFEAFDEGRKEALEGTLQVETEEQNFGLVDLSGNPKFNIPQLSDPTATGVQVQSNTTHHVNNDAFCDRAPRAHARHMVQSY